MYFERSKIQAVKSHVGDHARNIKVVIDLKDKSLFDFTLDTIINEKQYNQGEQISTTHLNLLKAVVNQTIKHMENHLIDSANDPNTPTPSIPNIVDYFATATDYLYVKAQEKLGCPNMPLFIFDEKIDKAIENASLNVSHALVKHDISKQDVYKQQRRKDADVVSRNLEKHWTAIQNGENKPEHLGRVIAEYQALQKRQNGHGAIWRFFHGAENEARTNLLRSLSEKIKDALPKPLKGIDLSTVDPSDVARTMTDARIRGELAVAGEQRLISKTEKIFGQLDAERELLNQKNELELNRQQMNTNPDFLKDVNGKQSEISNRIDDQSLNKDNIITKDDNDFRILD